MGFAVMRAGEGTDSIRVIVLDVMRLPGRSGLAELMLGMKKVNLHGVGLEAQDAGETG